MMAAEMTPLNTTAAAGEILNRRFPPRFCPSCIEQSALKAFQGAEHDDDDAVELMRLPDAADEKPPDGKRKKNGRMHSASEIRN
jgi:hypothetical protein